MSARSCHSSTQNPHFLQSTEVLTMAYKALHEEDSATSLTSFSTLPWLRCPSARPPGTTPRSLASGMPAMCSPWGICTDLSTRDVLLRIQAMPNSLSTSSLLQNYLLSKVVPTYLKGQPNPLQHSPFYVSHSFLPCTTWHILLFNLEYLLPDCPNYKMFHEDRGICEFCY